MIIMLQLLNDVFDDFYRVGGLFEKCDGVQTIHRKVNFYQFSE